MTTFLKTYETQPNELKIMDVARILHCTKTMVCLIQALRLTGYSWLYVRQQFVYIITKNDALFGNEASASKWTHRKKSRAPNSGSSALQTVFSKSE